MVIVMDNSLVIIGLSLFMAWQPLKQSPKSLIESTRLKLYFGFSLKCFLFIFVYFAFLFYVKKTRYWGLQNKLNSSVLLHAKGILQRANLNELKDIDLMLINKSSYT